MAPAVWEQALRFAWALGLGAGLGLVYEFLRGLRRVLPAATVPADLIFLLLTAGVMTWYGLALCQGALELFQLFGLLAGAILVQLTLGRALRGIFQGFWQLIEKLFSFAIWPGKVFLKETKKFLKFLFSIGEKWVIIIINRKHKAHSGGKQNENASKVSAVVFGDEAVDFDGGGFIRRYPGISAESNPGEPGPNPGPGSPGRRADGGKPKSAGGHRRSRHR